MYFFDISSDFNNLNEILISFVQNMNYFHNIWNNSNKNFAIFKILKFFYINLKDFDNNSNRFSRQL